MADCGRHNSNRDGIPERSTACSEDYPVKRSNAMNKKRGFLWITAVFSIAPVIFGILMALFGGSTDAKTLGFAMAVVGPAVIWGVYACAYYPFKGFFSS